ncbi:hypothetical protein Cni_G11983 [Canna indica]|uniref:BZIP domain-containing protein n=1 Tax=Canna indica TaxID=4628 RepID=A0AAQ3K9U1_9LILI|nr:hypothetical protein Cni_G11983 [Canna indica]
MDERKQKRKISNRESARRSRMKKQRHLEDLVNKAAHLKAENGQMLTQVCALEQHHRRLESENAILRVEAADLTERLRSLNSVLRFAEEVNGVAMDVAEIPEPLLKPWQQPRPALPVMARALNT